MAKKQTKARAPSSAGKTVARIIAAVIAVVILTALCAGIIITYKHTNGFATAFKTFYVEVNGKRYYDDGDVVLKKHGATNFKCGYMFQGSEEDYGKFSCSITSAATKQTAFNYTVDGIAQTFEGGEDYTDYFNITVSENGFDIFNEEDTPLEVLQRKYAGNKVAGQATDPKISYFTLTITSEDNQTVSFALTFDSVVMDLDPGQIVFSI